MKILKSKPFLQLFSQAPRPLPKSLPVVAFLCFFLSILSGNVKADANAPKEDGQDRPTVPLKQDARSLKPSFDEQRAPATSLPAWGSRLVEIEKSFAQVAPPPATSPPIAVPQPVAPVHSLLCPCPLNNYRKTSRQRINRFPVRWLLNPLPHIARHLP